MNLVILLLQLIIEALFLPVNSQSRFRFRWKRKL